MLLSSSSIYNLWGRKVQSSLQYFYYLLQVWQAFVGVKTRRVESYYENLLAQEICSGESKEQDVQSGAFGKWRKQIEKVISCKRLGLYFDL